MSFYAVLPSNACPKTQPNNNASNYIIDLENPIQFEGNWEVALTEYTFNQFNMLSDDPATVLYTKIHHYYKEYYLSLDVNGKFKVSNAVTKLDDNTYVDLSIDDKFKVSNAATKIDDNTYADGFFKFTYNKTDHPIRVECSLNETYIVVFDSETNALKFGFPTKVLYNVKKSFASTTRAVPGISDKLSVRIYWPRPFYYDKKILPQYPLFRTTKQLKEYFVKNLANIITNVTIDENKIFSFEPTPDINAITFDEELASKLGFEKQTLFNCDKAIDHKTGVASHKTQVFKGTKKVKVMKAFEQLLIYTSVSDPIIVGDVKVPLLGAVWVDTRNGPDEIIHDTMDHPMYIPISTKSINNMEVNIRNDGGKLIQFPYGSKSTLILHFRKT